MHRLRHADLAMTYRLPEPRPAPITALGFMVCPGCCLQQLSFDQLVLRQLLYRAAYERAQAELRPSLPERDLLAVWN